MMRIVESISEQAARWAIRADTGPPDPDGQRALEEWLEADPRHRGAYVRMRARWLDLDRLAALGGSAPTGPTTAAAPQPLPKVSIPLHAGAGKGVSRRNLLAASFVALAVAGGGTSWLILRGGRERYTSAIGEVRRVALPDGSTMLLNTDTEVTVQLAQHSRDIRLIRGEALFDVAPDKARPFIVVAHDTAVRALGTAFAVRLESSQIDVTVTDGVVEVGRRSSRDLGKDAIGLPQTRLGTQRVSAHQKMILATTHAPEIRPIGPAEVDRQLAWRDGLASFDGESLQIAVAQINRHNRRHIVVDDPALAAMQIFGVFRTTDPEGFAATVASALGARRTDRGEVIELQPRSSP